MVVAAMSTAEKLALAASGSSGDARLGIPPLRGIDGPNGVGEGHSNVTAFPDAETIAASWSTAIGRGLRPGARRGDLRQGVRLALRPHDQHRASPPVGA